MANAMNIRQAARWAESKGARDLYAVTDNNMVVLLGGYDKCQKYIRERCGMNYLPGQTSIGTGSYAQVGNTNTILRLDSLDEVAETLYESECEAMCIPDVREQREWA
jgi:hypothetical protein